MDSGKIHKSCKLSINNLLISYYINQVALVGLADRKVILNIPPTHFFFEITNWKMDFFPDIFYNICYYSSTSWNSGIPTNLI